VQGYKGCILADSMGLGKSLQTVPTVCCVLSICCLPPDVCLLPAVYCLLPAISLIAYIVVDSMDSGTYFETEPTKIAPFQALPKRCKRAHASTATPSQIAIVWTLLKLKAPLGVNRAIIVVLLYNFFLNFVSSFP
jgi:hypothetical protein